MAKVSDQVYAEGMHLRQVTGLRGGDGGLEGLVDTVVEEVTVRLYLNQRFLAALVASRAHLSELGAGFVLCERLADSVQAVSVLRNEIHVSADACETPEMPEWILGSGGGWRSEREPRKVTGGPSIHPREVHRFVGALSSEAWKRTGALHCTALLRGGRPLARRCDIGRHNSLDKAVGFAVLRGVDLAQCVLVCTGRQTAGMVAKVANAGVPIAISKAATTYEAIALAEQTGVTLICFARGRRFRVYTHPERVQGFSADDGGSPAPATE